MNAELEESLDAVGGVLVAGVQRLDDGEPLGVLVLARAADDSDVGLRRRHPVDAEEAERVAVRLDAAAVEHGREHERLAGAVLRAGDVEPLRPADDGGAELVALGELVVDDGGGAEEEVLERGAGRQVAGVDEGDVLVAAVAVAVALDDGGEGRAAEAGDVGDVVAVDEVAGALRQRHRALDREDVVVRPRERELPVRRRARHHARHDARRRLRPAQDVVHEERQLVVVARAGTTTSRAHPALPVAAAPPAGTAAGATTVSAGGSVGAGSGRPAPQEPPPAPAQPQAAPRGRGRRTRRSPPRRARSPPATQPPCRPCSPRARRCRKRQDKNHKNEQCQDHLLLPPPPPPPLCIACRNEAARFIREQ